jgi:hypothetical protein
MLQSQNRVSIDIYYSKPQNILKLNYLTQIFKSQKKIFYDNTYCNITVPSFDVRLKSLEECITKAAYHE